MKKWKLVVDSSSDIRKEYYGDIVEIVPLTITIGDKVFIDNDDLNIEELLKEMKKHKEAGSTACPSPGAFYEAYKGAENVICFTVTASLSGTYNSAVLAKNMMENENPNINVHVINTSSVSATSHQLVLKAIELINENKTFDEVISILTDYLEELDLVAIVGAYDNLAKTGRVSPMIAKVANVLNIKQVVTVSDHGTIEAFKKVHGTKNGYKVLAETAAKANGKHPVIITHCMNIEGAEYVKELIQQQINIPVTIYPVKSLCAFYLMEGGVFVTF